MKELIVDYIEGNLDGELHSYVQAQIEKNGDFKEEYDNTSKVLDAYNTIQPTQPSEKVKARFYDFLEEEIAKNTSKRIIPFYQSTVFKIAASIALVISGVWIGIEWQSSVSNPSNIVEVEYILDELKNNSASQRLRVINTAANFKSQDDQIMEALFFTLNFDENTNVRLAALNAIGKFIEQDGVKNQLVRSLKFQDNPTIQIALINLFVELKETEILSPLKDLMEDENTEDFVKDEAQMGIFKLS